METNKKLKGHTIILKQPTHLQQLFYVV